MPKKRNTKKGGRKKSTRPSSKKQSGMFMSGFSGSFQIVGISLLFGFGLFAMVTVFEKISTSAAFQVDKIKWLGLQSLKEDEILKRYKPVVGQNIFQVDIDAVHRHLLLNPRIKAATVKKDFPNHLLIIVEEKQPAAARFEIDENAEQLTKRIVSVMMIDADAKVLQAGLDPEIELPAGLPRLLYFRRQSYPKALALGAVLGNHRGLFVDLSDPEDLIVYFTGEEDEQQVGLLHFGGSHFKERWKHFLAIEEDLKARGLLHWEIDLRFSGQAIVKNGALKQRPVVSGRLSDTTYF